MVTSFKGAEKRKLPWPTRWSLVEGTVLLEDAIRNEIEGTLWLGLLEGEGIGIVAYVEKAQQLYSLVICLSREGSGVA